jgi:hypothetical protein
MDVLIAFLHLFLPTHLCTCRGNKAKDGQNITTAKKNGCLVQKYKRSKNFCGKPR